MKQWKRGSKGGARLKQKGQYVERAGGRYLDQTLPKGGAGLEVMQKVVLNQKLGGRTLLELEAFVDGQGFGVRSVRSKEGA